MKRCLMIAFATFCWVLPLAETCASVGKITHPLFEKDQLTAWDNIPVYREYPSAFIIKMFDGLKCPNEPGSMYFSVRRKPVQNAPKNDNPIKTCRICREREASPVGQFPCFPREYKVPVILTIYSPNAIHRTEHSIPNGLIAHALLRHDRILVSRVCIKKYCSVCRWRSTNIFESKTHVNSPAPGYFYQRSDQFHIFNRYPRPPILAHFGQLVVENPIRCEGKDRRQPNDNQHLVFSRIAFAILSALFLILGIQMFAYSVNAGGYSVPNSVLSFVAGLALFLAAGVVFFLFALGLPLLQY